MNPITKSPRINSAPVSINTVPRVAHMSFSSSSSSSTYERSRSESCSSISNDICELSLIVQNSSGVKRKSVSISKPKTHVKTTKNTTQKALKNEFEDSDNHPSDDEYEYDNDSNEEDIGSDDCVWKNVTDLCLSSCKQSDCR